MLLLVWENKFESIPVPFANLFQGRICYEIEPEELEKFGGGLWVDWIFDVSIRTTIWTVGLSMNKNASK
jgi:hypothetical protein